ncbi:MAG TPA: c-type cytochrome [Piscinibacter sp.]|jgi:cytochrome c|uniref:c-type cytochrome n=1 Tax=Piscinibacter sp. TaxID=1903157 RepID=UPI001E174B59|nr:c-type cytochrome [Piscinibacter sp.]MBK7529155.1 c-type cytochrome [Piscinibacter sp.]HNW62441.1 c-type cytochrome [Piscinibacter sp.]HOY34103.1 c-type cytochrome [Piscinibacter sp.]HPG77338.1 c-type cytochrome [Piscinibacter sp.]HPM65689.1 c-type cytochrome [Piscinibacter sp.]
MKLFPVLALVAAAATVSAPAVADEALAKAKNCLACHATDKKVLGPSYKEVAAKYAGQKDAADKLAAKVIKGGVGVWGQIPMPANAQVNEAESKKLVAWILSLK